EVVGLALDGAYAEPDLPQEVHRRREPRGWTADVLQHAIDGAQEQRERDEERGGADDRQQSQDDERVHRSPPPSTHAGHSGHPSAGVFMAAVPAATPAADLRMEPATCRVVCSSAMWIVLLATCWPTVQIADTPVRMSLAARRMSVRSAATTSTTTR